MKSSVVRIVLCVFVAVLCLSGCGLFFGEYEGKIAQEFWMAEDIIVSKHDMIFRQWMKDREQIDGVLITPQYHRNVYNSTSGRFETYCYYGISYLPITSTENFAVEIIIYEDDIELNPHVEWTLLPERPELGENVYRSCLTMEKGHFQIIIFGTATSAWESRMVCYRGAEKLLAAIEAIEVE